VPAAHFKNGVGGELIERGAVGRAMMRNLTIGRPPFDGQDHFTFYSDLTTPMFMGLFEGHFYFREIYEAYPDTVFVLNTRRREDWITSRTNHGGDQIGRYKHHYGLADDQAVIQLWRSQWDSHHENVQEFFANKPEQLIVFDIDKHTGADLAVALETHLPLDPALWSHEGKTTPQQERDAKLLRAERHRKEMDHSE